MRAPYTYHNLPTSPPFDSLLSLPTSPPFDGLLSHWRVELDLQVRVAYLYWQNNKGEGDSKLAPREMLNQVSSRQISTLPWPSLTFAPPPREAPRKPVWHLPQLMSPHISTHLPHHLPHTNLRCGSFAASTGRTPCSTLTSSPPPRASSSSPCRLRPTSCRYPPTTRPVGGCAGGAGSSTRAVTQPSWSRSLLAPSAPSR